MKVISGNQIPYKSESNIRKDRELHVLVRVAGVEADNQKEKSKTVKSNGTVLHLITIKVYFRFSIQIWIQLA